ncbi:MAG: queuosine precursor transporter [Propionibacteriaceae bacterium]|nr:queuosine precursor transporter [Propionibacteriaceae bacterium]
MQSVPERTRVYDLVLAGFCGLLLISNVGATKLIGFGSELVVNGFQLLPIIVDGGVFLFPLTYILGDVIAEVYGLKRANRAIFVGFALAGLASLTFWIIDLSPAAADWPIADAWHQVLGFVPRIVVASLLAYLAGQLLNAFILVRIKQRWGEGRLWARLLTSTVVGEFVDTLIFCLISYGWLGAIFGGDSIPAATLLNYILVGWIYKVLIEIVLLPLTYRIIALVRRHEDAG